MKICAKLALSILVLLATPGCDRFLEGFREGRAERRDAAAAAAAPPATTTTVATAAAPPPATTTHAPAAPAAPPAPPAPAPANPGGPRLGKYIMLAYGARSVPIYIGRVELLSGGRYGVSNTATGPYYGEGTYSFDAAGSNVLWLTGPMKTDGYTGTFTVEREGKTHKIRLRSSTIATNSTDS